jgi:sortase A
MTSRRTHLRCVLTWLERALWTAGCCALGYYIFINVDASLTQRQLTRSFEKSQTHVGVTSQTTLDYSPADVHQAPARPGSRLIGRLEIPKLDVSSVILEGVGPQTLRVALGHVPGTSLPGKPGNVVIAGHRDTFFRPLRKIAICDQVSVDTTARTYYYQVRSFEVVDPRNVNALRFHNKNELTLITCYPFSYIGPAPKRFVVHAEPVIAPEKYSQS